MSSGEEQRFVDQYKYKGLRKRLVKHLAEKADFDQKLLDAIEVIPRHFFLESAFAEHAYEDKAFSIGEGQTISQPYTVAYQTQLLDVKPGMKVLEIGTGSGYQAAILAKLGVDLYSVERIEKLSKKAGEVLKALRLPVKLFVGDGTLGLPKFAPYDRILVTAAAPVVPEALRQQLTIGGKLVIPVGDREMQEMVCIIREGEDEYKKVVYEGFRFVPLIGEQGW